MDTDLALTRQRLADRRGAAELDKVRSRWSNRCIVSLSQLRTGRVAVRCVEWVRAICLIAVMAAGPIGAAAESAPVDTATDADPSSDDETDPGDLVAAGVVESSLEAELGSGLGGSLGVSLERSLAASLRAQLGGPEPGAGDFGSAMASMPSSAGIASSSLFAPFPSAALSGGSQADQMLLFAGTDVWRNGLSNFSGVQWAAAGLDNDGFIVRMSLADGVERYRTLRRTYVSEVAHGSLLLGWRFKIAEFELKLLAGPDFEYDSARLGHSSWVWRGAQVGLHIAGEAWAQPTPESMLAASFYATTLASGFGIRTAAGWRLIDSFWVGPELIGARDQFSRQTRFGLHFTGLKFGLVEWSAAWGYVSDSFGRSGSYARLAAQMRP